MYKKNIGKILMLSLPLVVIIVFLLITAVSRKSIPSSIVSNLGPTPSLSPVEPEPLSPWAQDEKFVQLEQKIIETEKKLDSVNLNELELTPPILDLDRIII